MEFFEEMGATVEQRWKDVDYDEEAFPAIARQALVESPPYKNVDPWDVIRWLNTTTQLPYQQDLSGVFGDPPITLYNGSRFYIDIYYWLDGTTSIHQHAFSGAFQILLGSSIHCQYGFEEMQKVDDHFLVGQTTLESVGLLKEGDIREILLGKQYIHSLFHLERPSATVVIKTHRSTAGSPQYDYQKPYFAVDPFYESPALIKRFQSASLLLGMRHPDTDNLIGQMIHHSDFHTAVAILNLAFNSFKHDQMTDTFGLSAGEERFQSYLEIARRRHGHLADLILPVFEESERQHHLIHKRSQITSSEHRFFLALLLNVPDRAKIIELVKQRFPERDAVATITEWVDELANTRLIGSADPNVLGIDDYSEDYLFAFQCLLEGMTIEQTRAAFAREFSAEDEKLSASKAEELCTVIMNSITFKTVFHDSATTPTRKLTSYV